MAVNRSDIFVLMALLGPFRPHFIGPFLDFQYPRGLKGRCPPPDGILEAKTLLYTVKLKPARYGPCNIKSKWSEKMNVYVVPELAGSLLTKLTIFLFLVEKLCQARRSSSFFYLVRELFVSSTLLQSSVRADIDRTVSVDSAQISSFSDNLGSVIWRSNKNKQKMLFHLFTYVPQPTLVHIRTE